MVSSVIPPQVGERNLRGASQGNRRVYPHPLEVSRPPHPVSALRYLQLHRARITTTAQNLRYIASQLSAFICQPEAYLPDVYNTLERCFGLPKASIEDAITLALGEVDSVAEMFELEIDSEQDKLEVIKKAHEALTQLSQQLAERQPLPDTYTPSLDDLERQLGDRSARHVLRAIEHEIRNPLTAVGGFARRLARTVDPASDQGKYIGIILSEAARLEAALNGIAQALHL